MPTASLVVTIATLAFFGVFMALVAYGLHKAPKGWPDPNRTN